MGRNNEQNIKAQDKAKAKKVAREEKLKAIAKQFSANKKTP